MPLRVCCIQSSAVPVLMSSCQCYERVDDLFKMGTREQYLATMSTAGSLPMLSKNFLSYTEVTFPRHPALNDTPEGSTVRCYVSLMTSFPRKI